MNVLLIILDATRADFCSCYESSVKTTPSLDNLAAEGVLFERAISPAPWTLPAISSIFTGLYPSQTSIYERRLLSATFPTLAEILSKNGYATFCITNNSWISAEFGLQRGFKTVHRQWQIIQSAQEINRLILLEKSRSGRWLRTLMGRILSGNLFINLANIAFTRLVAYRRDLGASRILTPFIRWIEKQRGPWFACVHFMEAHLPYKPPLKWALRFVEYSKRMHFWLKADQWRAAWRHIAGVELLSEEDLEIWRRLYMAEIAYADFYLGRLVEWLRKTDRLDDTLVIVVADHGENLGEHGLLNHQYCLYDTLLRVPLVIRYPKLLPAGERIFHQVQTLDIFKTVLDFAKINFPSTVSRNLFSEEKRHYVIAEYGVPKMPHPRNLARFGLKEENLSRFQRGLMAIRTDEYKLIVGTDGSKELYKWPSDPGEKHNMARLCPEIVQSLEEIIDEWRKEHSAIERGLSGELEISPETEARLRALGYID